MMRYSYYINLDERGEFFADVRDEYGTTVLEIHGFDVFEDGFMDHKNDLRSLECWLRDLGHMVGRDTLEAGQ